MRACKFIELGFFLLAFGFTFTAKAQSVGEPPALRPDVIIKSQNLHGSCPSGWHRIGTPYPSEWCGYTATGDAQVLYSDSKGRCVSEEDAVCDICIHGSDDHRPRCISDTANTLKIPLDKIVAEPDIRETSPELDRAIRDATAPGTGATR
jgi:hypothetical protein